MKKIPLLIACSTLLSPSLHALDTTWTGAADSNFANPSNWTGAAPTSSDTAIFNSDPALTNQPVVSGASSALGMNFATGGWTVGGAGTLTLGTGGIRFIAASGADTVQVNTTLNSNVGGGFRVDSGLTLQINANVINSSGNTNKTGAGTLEIGSAWSSYTRNFFNLAEGTLLLSANDAIYSTGSQSVRFNQGNGTANLLVSGAYTFGRSVSFNTASTATKTIGGSNTSGTGVYTGAIYMGSDRTSPTFANQDLTLTAAGGGTVRFDGVIRNGVAADGTAAAGAASLTLTRQNASGTGTIVFNAANTYTAATIVEEGVRLLVNGSTSGAGVFTIENGGIIGGTGTVGTNNANVTVNDGGTLAAGDSGAGALSLDLGSGQLVLESGSLFEFDLGTFSDTVDLLSGQLAIGDGTLGFSDFNFILGEGFGTGTYDLFTSGETISGFLDGSDLTGMLNDRVSTLSIDGNNLRLTVVPEPGAVGAFLAGIGMLLGVRRFRRKN